MATGKYKKKDKGTANVNSRGTVHNIVVPMANDSDKDEPHIPWSLLVAVLVLCLVLVIALPIMGIMYMDMNNATAKAMEEVKKMRELRAKIMLEIIEREEKLRDLLKPNDIFLLDRGFRDAIDKLNNQDVITIDVTEKKLYGMFWRFFAVDLPNSEYCVFRDTDSRITIREKMAVDEWVNSGKSIHVMRDHPAHGIPFGSDRLGILGGMWGIKSKSVPLTEMIERFTKNKNLVYGSDQTFLKTIYSIFEDDITTHDEFYEKKPFPIKREYGRFVGDRIDENDKPVGTDFKSII